LYTNFVLSWLLNGIVYQLMATRLLDLTKVKDRITREILPKGTKEPRRTLFGCLNYIHLCYREVKDGGMKVDGG